jgi:hypothetical protein
MSTIDDTVREIELQAARGRSSIRHDLDALVLLLPAEVMIARWRGLQVRPQDIRQVRREFAKACHPDRALAKEEAARRLALANALLDQAMKVLAIKPRPVAGATTHARGKGPRTAQERVAGPNVAPLAQE